MTTTPPTRALILAAYSLDGAHTDLLCIEYRERQMNGTTEPRDAVARLLCDHGRKEWRIEIKPEWGIPEATYERLFEESMIEAERLIGHNRMQIEYRGWVAPFTAAECAVLTEEDES